MSSTTLNIVINGKGTITGVDAINKGLQSVSDTAKKTQQGVNSAVNFNLTASIPGLQKLQSVVSGVSNAFSALKTVAIGGAIGAAFIRGISSAVDESVKLENALIGVNSVARSFGQDTEKVKDAVLEFTKDGLVSATDAALAFKQVLSTGQDLPTAIKLLNSLKDTAAFNRQAFYSLGEAIIATTEGIKNGNSNRADAVGVTKNLSVLEKEYAASLGTTIGKLDTAQQYQARVNGFIREGAFASGDAAKLLQTYSGQVSQLSTAYDRALARIGDFITKSALVQDAISGLTRVFKGLESSLAPQTSENRIKVIKTQLDGFLKDVSNSPYKKELEAELKLLERHVEVTKTRNDLALAAKQQEIAIRKENEKTAEIQAKAVAQRLKDLKALDKKIKDGGESEIQTLDKFYAKSLKLIGSDTDRKVQLDKYYYGEKQKLEDKDFASKQSNARKLYRVQKQINDALASGAQDPFKYILTPATVKAAGQDAVDKFNTRKNIGRGVGLLDDVVGGAAGASKLVSGIAQGALNLYIPGLGTAAKPLLDAFTQGPTAVKSMVKEFAKALPGFAQALIEAAPAFIQTLVDQAPTIIDRIIDRLPRIIETLIGAIPKIALSLALVVPKLAVNFVTELIKNIPRVISELARAVYDGVKKVLDGLNPFSSSGSSAGGNGLSGALKTGPTSNGTVNLGLNVATLGVSGAVSAGLNAIGIKLAEGGEVSKVARGGTPFKDSINARLMEGELVVDRTTTAKLKKSLDNPGQGNSDDLLNRIVDLLSQPMSISHDVKVNNEAFAKIILQLNRTNQRLA